MNDGILEHLMVHALNDEWKKLRTKVSPTFSSVKMKQMLLLIEDCAKEVTKAFEEYAVNSESFNADKIFGLYTIDVIARTAFATRIDYESKENNPFVKHVNGLMQLQFPLLLLLNDEESKQLDTEKKESIFDIESNAANV
ncbi:hypothetical protein B4U79_14565, partial [Dinothrombium tinctorium]